MAICCFPPDPSLMNWQSSNYILVDHSSHYTGLVVVLEREEWHSPLGPLPFVSSLTHTTHALTHMHTYTHQHTCSCTHTRAHACVHTCTHTHTLKHAHTHACTYPHLHIYIHTMSCTHIPSLTYTHACSHTNNTRA